MDPQKRLEAVRWAFAIVFVMSLAGLAALYLRFYRLPSPWRNGRDPRVNPAETTPPPNPPPPPIFKDSAGVFTQFSGGYSFGHDSATQFTGYRDGGFEAISQGNVLFEARLDQINGSEFVHSNGPDSLNTIKQYAIEVVTTAYAADTPEGTVDYDIDTVIISTNSMGARILDLQLAYPGMPSAKRRVCYATMTIRGAVCGVMIPSYPMGIDTQERLDIIRRIAETIGPAI